MLVVDDALLLAALARDVGPDLDEAVQRGEIFTTGTWYFRLSRATHDQTVMGALSSTVAALPPEQQARVLAGLDELPPQIGLLSLRRLVPVMGRLEIGRTLNLLTSEAVAAARTLDAAIQVTTETPLLRHACHALAIDLTVVPL